jgi:hypothetical protein
LSCNTILFFVFNKLFTCFIVDGVVVKSGCIRFNNIIILFVVAGCISNSFGRISSEDELTDPIVNSSNSPKADEDT